jgi:hypothetical protein
MNTGRYISIGRRVKSYMIDIAPWMILFELLSQMIYILTQIDFITWTGGYSTQFYCVQYDPEQGWYCFLPNSSVPTRLWSYGSRTALVLFKSYQAIVWGQVMWIFPEDWSIRWCILKYWWRQLQIVYCIILLLGQWMELVIIEKAKQKPTTKATLRHANSTLRSELPQVSECAICLQEFHKQDPPIQLNCHPLHVFHRWCIQTWLSINPQCPTCRREFHVS